MSKETWDKKTALKNWYAQQDCKLQHYLANVSIVPSKKEVPKDQNDAKVSSSVINLKLCMVRLDNDLAPSPHTDAPFKKLITRQQLTAHRRICLTELRNPTNSHTCAKSQNDKNYHND